MVVSPYLINQGHYVLLYQTWLLLYQPRLLPWCHLSTAASSVTTQPLATMPASVNDHPFHMFHWGCDYMTIIWYNYVLQSCIIIPVCWDHMGFDALNAILRWDKQPVQQNNWRSKNESRQSISHENWLFQEVSHVATSSLKASTLQAKSKKVGSSMLIILHSLYRLKLDNLGVKLPCTMLCLPGHALNPKPISSC